MHQAPDAGRGVVLVIAPVGRDAPACATLVAQAGMEPHICGDVGEAIELLKQGVDVVLLTEEAAYGKALAPLAEWVADQPPWSDQPFVVLTNPNSGPRFTEFRRDLAAKLRNIAFLERPLQAISLQTAVLTALRGRARQYQARDYLDAQRDAAGELERLVALRTAALEEANERLREESDRRERAQAALLHAQKIETMGQLVGGVAHDFNNLLMAVIGNLDLLTRYMPNDPRQERLVNGALEGARRGATLTQRLLAFARKQELQTRPVDVGALVEGMRGLIERSIGPMVDLQVVACDSAPPALADPNQLEMALLNLAINARDAMPAGGRLIIRIDERAPGPEHPRLGAERYVCLSVSDTGIGMDAPTLEKAVEPFFSTKGVGKGTGLGLSMVHGLAEQSGGLFELSSKLGFGATATLWLPAASGAVTEVSAAAGPEPAAQSATILLVDDDALIAASTADLLEDLGHKVVEVHSGPEALGALESGLQPDLIITDHAMPGMTGAELAVRIRQRSPALPILLATGYAELQGAQPLDLPRLAKPYTQAQLSTEIARLLPARRPHAAP